MSENSIIRVLPSEAAQSLAYYLSTRFTLVTLGAQKYNEVGYYHDDREVAQAIQDYWDSLP